MATIWQCCEQYYVEGIEVWESREVFIQAEECPVRSLSATVAVHLQEQHRDMQEGQQGTTSDHHTDIGKQRMSDSGSACRYQKPQVGGNKADRERELIRKVSTDL